MLGEHGWIPSSGGAALVFVLAVAHTHRRPGIGEDACDSGAMGLLPLQVEAPDFQSGEAGLSIQRNDVRLLDSALAPASAKARLLIARLCRKA